MTACMTTKKKMLNPYILLTIVVTWLASIAGAAYVGYDYRDCKVAQQIVEATNDALSKANAQNEQSTIDAIERAKREAISRERARQTKSAGLADALANHSSNCDRNDKSVSLLNDSISSANGETSSTKRMPIKLRAYSETD